MRGKLIIIACFANAQAYFLSMFVESRQIVGLLQETDYEEYTCLLEYTMLSFHNDDGLEACNQLRQARIVYHINYFLRVFIRLRCLFG